MATSAPPPSVTPSDPPALIDVDEARRRVLAAFVPLTVVRVPLGDALGLTLAVDLVAGSQVPPFANAAMDGFAVRSADVTLAAVGRAVELRVVGEAPAGTAPDALVRPGEAVRIMTGAPTPPGADAVVRFEDTDELQWLDPNRGRTGGAIGIRTAVAVGENVRLAGEDIAAGSTVLTAGTRLRPAELGLLATLNRPVVSVHRRPRVAVLATGDEVVDPGERMGPGQIRNANGALVAGLIHRHGGESVMLGIARDRPDDLRARLLAVRDADLIVTTGGVSAGDYDLVKRVLQQEGRIHLWQVRIKPGKPLAFGWLGETPLLGLPGNPVAAAVAFEQFARPAIARMLGRPDSSIPTVPARLHGRIDNRGGRRHFARVSVRPEGASFVATPAGGQGSGMLSTLVRANALLVIPEDVPVAEPGTVWPAQMLDWDIG
jgi:molybdopterin molybdotransferase